MKCICLQVMREIVKLHPYGATDIFVNCSSPDCVNSEKNKNLRMAKAVLEDIPEQFDFEWYFYENRRH